MSFKSGYVSFRLIDVESMKPTWVPRKLMNHEGKDRINPRLR